MSRPHFHRVQDALSQLERAILDALEDIAHTRSSGEAVADLPSVQFERPVHREHGDWTTNFALQVAKHMPVDVQQPRVVAEKIIAWLTVHAPDSLRTVFADWSLAGPGFMNFRFSDAFLLDIAHDCVVCEREQTYICVDSPYAAHVRRVIVEFTDPNPFKEFHIGHLYSNTVGESISRLLECTGMQVHRVAYQGDAGMHVAKSLWGLLKNLLESDPGTNVGWLSGLSSTQEQHILTSVAQWGKKPLAERVQLLGQSYALGAKFFEDDAVAKKEIAALNVLVYLAAQQMLEEQTGWKPQVDYAKLLPKDLHVSQHLIKTVYMTGRQWSLDAFEVIYRRLGTVFQDYFFESLVGEYGVVIVNTFLQQGIFETSQGAVIFPGKKHGLHDRVFINSLGLPTYEAKELGLASEKYRRYPYDYSIIITANEIDEYFKVLLCALQKTNPDLAAKTRHLSHGMVKLPEGKMSSRKGNILTGEWLVDEATARILRIVQKNHPDWPVTQQQEVAEKIGVGAIKFALLKSALGKDIAFSFDTSLSFEGQSGPYLQYTYARCLALLRKGAEGGASSGHTEVLQAITSDHDLGAGERDILRLVAGCEKVLVRAIHECAPHQVCEYLYDVAQAFNAYYAHTPIATAPTEKLRNLRIHITSAVAAVMRTGLHVLGISVVEVM